jgi:hypothetical protein
MLFETKLAILTLAFLAWTVVVYRAGWREGRDDYKRKQAKMLYDRFAQDHPEVINFWRSAKASEQWKHYAGGPPK